jgi:hypothetical protein
MIFHQEPMAFGHRVLEIFYRLIFKFSNDTAARTDKMVMVLALGNVIVSGLAVSEMYLVGNPRLREKLQRTAYGGITDARMPGPHFSVQFLDACVPVRRKEGIENNVSLSRGLEPLRDNEIMKDLLLFPLHCRLSIENDFHYTQ